MPNKDIKADAPAVAQATLTFQRDDDFVARYANNVQIEPSGWDLKLVFGLLDQRNPAKPVIEQHTSINLSWPGVKLGIYMLQLHLALHEKENGKIRIPENGIPAEIPQIIPPEFDNQQGREAFDLMRKMRAQFIASLSEP